MMEESLVKSNFVGRDGFRWWVGQIPPIKDQGRQHNGPGWGNRYKVRIMGYHPTNEQELSNDDLPWAQVLLPATAGTGGANRSSSVMLTQGDVVFGFFLDGDNAQIPVIMGAFGRTDKVAEKDYTYPFVPFTGYTTNIPKPPTTLLNAGQAGDENAGSQKSPLHISPSQAVNIGQVSYSRAIGDIVRFANGSTGSVISKIDTEVANLIKFASNLFSTASKVGSFANKILSYEIDIITQKVLGVVSGLVNGIINQLYRGLAPLINKGLKLLYKLVYNLVLAATQNPAIAHIAGVAAQKAMVGPIQALQKVLPRLGNTIISGLSGTVRSLLDSAVKNISNFNSCISNQVSGVLTNTIIQKIASYLAPYVSALSRISQFFGGFNLAQMMRSTPEILSGFGQLLNAGQSLTNNQSSSNEWIIGRGPKSERIPSFSQILNTANNASAIAKSSEISFIQGFNDFVQSTKEINSGECYSGTPSVCNPPIIKIFGSNGYGATAIPIMGNIVGKGRNKKGSIIGVKIINRGSFYDFPPFIEIVDNCNQGYGAIARAVLDDFGQIDYIYMVSCGEGYPVGEIQPYSIDEWKILNPGQDYITGDTVKDNFGNEYTIEAVEGEITKINPLNIVASNITELPIYNITSENGSGALIIPIIDNISEKDAIKKQIKTKGQIKQNIDCITK